ncbi:membrane-bound O-acyltransferase domain-containing protein 1 [Magnaporthiopsis poae ATCC 64411]|uniref:Membrane-bound O-acyltransferase domain-containing protein 1 n=1 Tax=Magnaporthiopsis poae (strain ATCC 64411 / 73-15) TaxID=644358 RepID=A0A0C4E745_MAGP6|nr:membrane-bound O-acyltransferase domain-containing protein 1 [Magnaporthiopsis poae ATCC 64411]
MLPYVNIPFVYLSGKIGAAPDDLKLVATFLLSYPLAGVLKRIPDSKPHHKNLFSIAIALFYLVGLFDLWTGLRTLFISSAAAYAIAKYLRGSPYMPWVGFLFLMGHMSANQLRRQFANSPQTADITGAQMVMVMKLSAFCWNVADGTLPDDQLSDFQRDRVIRELPSLLDYAGYVLFFPSLLAGPAFDYAEYRRWLDTSMFDTPAAVDPVRKAPTRKKRRIPRSATPAILTLMTGLGWTLAFVYLSSYYHADLVTGPEYMRYSFLRRVFILHMFNFTARCKYYGAWSLAEGSCILAGLGYNGVDPVTGKVAWDRVQNIYPWGVESAQNTRAYIENWNKKTNMWLRNYIYLRVTPRGKKPGFRASMATFVTSATWHGFYPGYYLTFVLASFIQTVAKNFRRYCRPFFLDPVTQKPLPSKRLYDVFSYLVTQVTFTFATTPFLLLAMDTSLLVWSRVYFYAVGGIIASMAFFASPAKQVLRKKLEERQAKAAGSNGGKGRGAPLQRISSTDSINRLPVLGISGDPAREVDEAMAELKSEIELRARRSSVAAQNKG